MTSGWALIWENTDRFAAGALLTVELTVLTMVLAIPGGLVLAFLRLSRWRVIRFAATAFVELFRSTPLILQIYWVYYILPVFTEIRLPGLAVALTGLVCNISSYNSETFRAGIVSIRRGQWNSGLALGMTNAQVMLRIVLPQAAMRVLPALASTWVSLFKDTALVSVIHVGDLAYVALKIRTETFVILPVLNAMALFYWLMGYPQAKLVDWIHRRYKVAE
jgi:His/Glu/Gln/Arg/opine family amino acid ABC transporter permease subunit